MTVDQRNLVMVTVDSLRADHCGFVNPDSDLTPTIDRLADDGVSFTQAVAPGPRTPSSVPVFFSGEFMTDDESWTMADWQGRQARLGEHMRRFTHLSERLKRQGYKTAAFTANPWTTRESSFNLGFDEFTEISADSPDVSAKHLSDSTLFKVANTGIETLPSDPFGWSSKKEWFSQWPGSFDLVEKAISDLPEPFFLWVFILDSHQPYITPRRYREESAAWEMYYAILRYWEGETTDEELPKRARKLIGSAYRDAVRSVDAFVETIHEATQNRDPVTVFTSDHGEAVGEHGNFGHEQTLFEENLRVPLFVHGVDASETVDEQLPLRGVPELLVDLSEGGVFDPRDHTQRFVISKTENNRTRSVRTPRWKFISDIATGTEQLYDLAADPDETTDVRAEYSEVGSLLSDLLDRHETTQAEKATIEEATTDLLAAEGSL
ncbi:sulfatase-like hydrolase/transferase [Haloquadratum walsbyi]|nr:sulfatase-like hydrolase/transferase [Haloquadratum walsbyi]